MNKKVKNEIIKLMIYAIIAFAMGHYISHHQEKVPKLSENEMEVSK